jgi:pyridoxamine 5'-phosphate oxidase
MITFQEISNSTSNPFKILQDNYLQAIKNNQNAIEAIAISSLDANKKYVDSRFVNLKFVNSDSLIFFSNYESNKAAQFNSNKEVMVSALLYWNTINTQIRMRGLISECDKNFSDGYFINRNSKKNALAISSQQSKKINSYNDVVSNYNFSLENSDLLKRPKYWGGYQIKPSYFEFWQGDQFRLNKRDVFEMKDNEWNHFILQP